jgi:hypothetical protein
MWGQSIGPAHVFRNPMLCKSIGLTGVFIGPVFREISGTTGVFIGPVFRKNTGTTGIYTVPGIRAPIARTPGSIMATGTRMVTGSMFCRMVLFHSLLVD